MWRKTSRGEFGTIRRRITRGTRIGASSNGDFSIAARLTTTRSFAPRRTSKTAQQTLAASLTTRQDPPNVGSHFVIAANAWLWSLKRLLGVRSRRLMGRLALILLCGRCRQRVSHVHHHDQTGDLWRAIEISCSTNAAHESPRTTKLYDRAGDEITRIGGSACESVFPLSLKITTRLWSVASAIRFKVRMVACVRPRSNLVTLA